MINLRVQGSKVSKNPFYYLFSSVHFLNNLKNVCFAVAIVINMRIDILLVKQWLQYLSVLIYEGCLHEQISQIQEDGQ